MEDVFKILALAIGTAILAKALLGPKTKCEKCRFNMYGKCAKYELREKQK